MLYTHVVCISVVAASYLWEQPVLDEPDWLDVYNHLLLMFVLSQIRTVEKNRLICDCRSWATRRSLIAKICIAHFLSCCVQMHSCSAFSTAADTAFSIRSILLRCLPAATCLGSSLC